MCIGVKDIRARYRGTSLEHDGGRGLGGGLGAW